MAKYVFICVQDHTVEVPATVLETRLGDGEVVNKIDIPAKTFTYTAGQKTTFRNKKDAAAFRQNMGKFWLEET